MSGVPGVAPLPPRWGVDTWVDTNDLDTKVAALAQQVGDAPATTPTPGTPPLVAVASRQLSPPTGQRNRHHPHQHRRRRTRGHHPPPPVGRVAAVEAIPHRAMRDTLYVLGWTLTPSRSDVLTRLASLDTAPPPLSATAAAMNAAFPTWAAAHGAAVAAAVNVVFFDFLTPPVVAAVTAAARRGGRVPAVEVVRRVTSPPATTMVTAGGGVGRLTCRERGRLGC